MGLYDRSAAEATMAMDTERTILGDEIQPIGVQPHQLDIEPVYPVFETFDPGDGVRRAICPRGRCTGLGNEEIWVSQRVSTRSTVRTGAGPYMRGRW